ncbi:MAG: alpha/beta hydrolase family protein [Pirellulaceae bacterium]
MTREFLTCFVVLFIGVAGFGVDVAAQSEKQAEPMKYRRNGYRAETAVEAAEWRAASRAELFRLLHMADQIAVHAIDERRRSALPLDERLLRTEDVGPYVRQEMTIQSRPDRVISVVVTIPRNAKLGTAPAVICIHGHGGNRHIVYERSSLYRGFARTLAESGYVTLSTDVGQHNVQDATRTLMGERLWDLMRVVDLAASRPEVDTGRIGCAGLSLGGEMAMWLGAMDERIAATVSSGFLTTMQNLRVGHCMCWDFPGLQERFEFADICALICPRALQCQNGLQERLPGGFPVELAERAMADIKRAYRVEGHGGPDRVQLATHGEGHVFDVEAGTAFLDAVLK